tara:strand:+ start:1128 stop:1418 length:291 start_codon:yes stop_codon:yes gene_type:complete
MAEKNLEKRISSGEKMSLEERGVKALENISESFRTIEDAIADLDIPMWSERLEWYLNEFFNIAKTKNVGNPDRPERDRPAGVGKPEVSGSNISTEE